MVHNIYTTNAGGETTAPRRALLSLVEGDLLMDAPSRSGSVRGAKLRSLEH